MEKEYCIVYNKEYGIFKKKYKKDVFITIQHRAESALKKFMKYKGDCIIEGIYVEYRKR